jgi:hypothetical protein
MKPAVRHVYTFCDTAIYRFGRFSGVFRAEGLTRKCRFHKAFSDFGHVAEWLRSGLQNRLPRFNSGRGLQQILRARLERNSWQFGGVVLRSVILVSAGLALAACSVSMSPRFAYIRGDGRDMSDPAVAQQFNQDRAACQSEMHKGPGTGDPHRNNSIAAGNDAVQDCMEEKGYLVVMQSEAEAKQQEFAAKAAEKARLEAEAAAPPPPPPPPPPPHRKAKAKPKPAAPAAASSPPPPPPAPLPAPKSSSN